MPSPSGVIAFLSDFGWRDPYAGIVRGVVESVGRGRVKVIDLTHDIPPFNVIAGAYVLYTSYRYFPGGTVFLAVVDPGVGTERKPITIETRRYFFVGPDNGILYPAAVEDGIVEVRVIENESVFLKPVSTSFHGRDVFAPTAVLLALGTPIEKVGRRLPLDDIARLELRDRCASEGEVRARVVYIDVFGNVALGLERECTSILCAERGRVEVESRSGIFMASCKPAFSFAEPGEMVLYNNSLGFPELAVNLGSAAEVLKTGIGDMLVLRRR
uniref:SAM-dependent chlorinase/fluorinase n=1 Tax=Fervidicoccus fontis TaxID=683846 RepID=A0A7J3ZKY8_9CREN